MQSFIRKIKIIVSEQDIVERIIGVLLLLLVYRLFAAVPLPNVNGEIIQSLVSSNQFFGFLNIFSGGGLSQLSLVMLGVSPYITASIIMQLLTVLSKELKSLYQEEGEIGRKKFQRMSRMLTVPIAILQGVGILVLLHDQGVIQEMNPLSFIGNVSLVVGGSFLAMWIAERISEFGIGNGTSYVIFAGIVAQIPHTVGQIQGGLTHALVPMIIAIVIATILVIAGVIFITEAERKVPVHYTRQVRQGQSYGGVSSHIPFRLNQAGVMPIIFAISILMFPQMIANFLLTSGDTGIASIAQSILLFLNQPLAYGIVYFLLVVVFTFFYTTITVEPHQMAENLHKNGAFIPGIRPGAETEDYIGSLVSKITLVGALFLGIIAIIPTFVQGLTGIPNLGIGGTSILIVVSVVLDVSKKLDALASTRTYH